MSRTANSGEARNEHRRTELRFPRTANQHLVRGAFAAQAGLKQQEKTPGDTLLSERCPPAPPLTGARGTEQHLAEAKLPREGKLLVYSTLLLSPKGAGEGQDPLWAGGELRPLPGKGPAGVALSLCSCSHSASTHEGPRPCGRPAEDVCPAR